MIKNFTIIWRLALAGIIVIFLSLSLKYSSLIINEVQNYCCLYIAYANIIILALGILLSRTPVNALVCLISLFLHFLYLLLNVKIEFLATLLLIIYIGAVTILFLFVIMLFNLKNLDPTETVKKYKQYTWQQLLGTAGFFLLFFLYKKNETLSFISGTITTQVDFKTNLFVNNIYKYNDLYIFTNTLYTDYSYLFLHSSLLLLIAMFGTLVLTSAKKDVI